MRVAWLTYNCAVLCRWGVHLQLDRGLAVVEQMVLEPLQAEPLALTAYDDVCPEEPARL